jgi:uncharacterized protein (TIGR03118 family)
MFASFCRLLALQGKHGLVPAALLVAIVVLGATASNAQHYVQTNLVSDIPGLASFTDPNLVNPWGLARSGAGPWWVANNGTGTSTLYNGLGQPFPVMSPLVVTIPGAPTGTVFNGTSDFQLAPDNPATFIFVGEDGTISGWNRNVDPTNALIKFAGPTGTANYKGVTLAERNGANFLYVANFLAGTVDLFDGNFAPFSLPAGAFTDPTLPPGFAPFNVQNIDGFIYVMYAMQDEEKADEVAGPGLGFVDKYDVNGVLLLQLNSGWWMNAPWGIALAPSDFGKESGRLLVGQFGSGQIATFDEKHGNYHGLMRGLVGHPLEIEGLWAIGFGNDGLAGAANELFFTAGIQDEEHGLFGKITPVLKGQGKKLLQHDSIVTRELVFPDLDNPGEDTAGDTAGRLRKRPRE